jgi:hypothetical protein
MKNPLEFSLLEIEALLREDADGPQREFTLLLHYVHDRQKYLRDFAVQNMAATIKNRAALVDLPKRKRRRLDEDLLDDCEIIIPEAS